MFSLKDTHFTYQSATHGHCILRSQWLKRPIPSNFTSLEGESLRAQRTLSQMKVYTNSYMSNYGYCFMACWNYFRKQAGHKFKHRSSSWTQVYDAILQWCPHYVARRNEMCTKHANQIANQGFQQSMVKVSGARQSVES